MRIVDDSSVSVEAPTYSAMVLSREIVRVGFEEDCMTVIVSNTSKMRIKGTPHRDHSCLRYPTPKPYLILQSYLPPTRSYSCKR